MLLPLCLGRLRPQVRRPSVPRPRPRQPADHRRGPRGQRVQRAPEAGARGGPGRGPPPALRRADPGPAPGRAVVGRRQDSQHSPLARLLFDRDPDGLVPPVRGEDAHRRRRRGGCPRPRCPGWRSSGSGAPPAARWQRRDRRAPPRLEAARFDRRSTPSGDGRRTRASRARCTSSPPSAASPSERAHLGRGAPALRRVRPEWRRHSWHEGDACRRPRAGRHAGRRAGRDGRPQRLRATRLRRRPTWPPAVARPSTARLTWRNVDLGDDRGGRGRVVHGHRRRRSGRWSDGVALRDIARRDRLDELGFEIPLVGGDEPVATLHVRGVADLLEAHLPARRPVARYAARLRDPALDGVLRGYLTGSLDLVSALPGGRFVLADYKTNRLGRPDETLTAWHYRPEALQAEMVAGPLPLAGDPLLGRAAPLPALATAGYEPGGNLGRGALPVRPRHERRGADDRSTTSPAASGRGARRPRWSTALSDLFDRGPRRDRRRARPTRSTPRWRSAPSGLLHVFNRAGVLSPSDVHVALRLGRLA